MRKREADKKVLRKVQGFGGLAGWRTDAGKWSPSRHVGIAPHAGC